MGELRLRAVPDELHTEYKVRGIREGKSLNETIIDALAWHLYFCKCRDQEREETNNENSSI